MLKVSIIGSGTMGTGLTQITAEKGMMVYFHNVNPVSLHAAYKRIDKNLENKVQKNKITAEEKESILNRILLFGDLKESVREADFVIEAIYEKLDAKKTLFANLNKFCRQEAVIASNTSTLSINQLAEILNKPDRFLGMHFFYPVPAMRLVEVVRGEQTSKDAIKTALELAERLGKVPIVVKDIPGFIVNRFLSIMVNEAAHLVEAGIASSEDIDKALKLGANHPMGILLRKVG